MARVKEDLTNQEKIEIIKGAQKLLGPKGENWIKGIWFGKKRGGFTPGQPRYESGLDEVKPSEADTWCVLGALEESAFRLGYSERRSKAGVLGSMTSLRKLAVDRLKGKGKFGIKSTTPLHVFNDEADTDWKDMKKLLNDRLRELRKEE